MITTIERILGRLPALEGAKNPNIAAVVGFLFGGIGLGVYFSSFIDTILPVGLTIAFLTVSAQFGVDLNSAFMFCSAIAAVYGYFRALTSNERLGST
jgi:hypothetical protein